MIDERKNVQTTPTRTLCKRSRPVPFYNPNKLDAPALEVYPEPSHHPTSPAGCRNWFKQYLLFSDIIHNRQGGSERKL